MVKKKVIVITGASSGIGFEYAKYFAKKKIYDLAVCSRNLKVLKKKFGIFKNVFVYKCDVSKEFEIKKFIKKVLNKYKKIDILINNAGNCTFELIEKINYKKIINDFRVNLFSNFIFIRECLPIMKKRKYGIIINISSGGSFNCVKGYSIYSATKAGVNTITKSLNNEINKDHNIKVFSISPGPCKTKMFPKNKLSPKASIPTIEKLIKDNKNNISGGFYFFKKKMDVLQDFKVKIR